MSLSNPTGSKNLIDITGLPIEDGKFLGWDNNKISNINAPSTDWGNPGQIGSVTPNSGKFTEVQYGASAIRIRQDSNQNFVNGNSPSAFINSSYNFFSGFNAGLSFTEGSHNFILGNLAGQNLQTGGTNFFAGSYAGYSLPSGDNNFFLGYGAGFAVTSASNTVIIGAAAGFNATNVQNGLLLGAYAGYLTQTAFNSVFLGYGAGFNQISSTNNLYLGSLTAFYKTSGDDNVILGGFGFYDATEGSNNVLIGTEVLRGVTNVSGCVVIGDRAGFGENQSNRLHIANNGSNSLIYGQFDNGNIGFNNFKSFNGIQGAIGISNRTTAPTSNPTNGGVISISNGEPKYLSTTGSERDIVTSPSPIPIRLLQATVATLPATTINNNGIAIVSDEPSNDRLAICDGSNWLFIPTTRSPIRPGRRLSLVSNTPFSSSEQSGNIIYYTSHENDAIPLWDSSRNVWRIWRGGELSRTLGTTPTIQTNIGANTNFNIYISWNAGNPIMLLEPWSNSVVGTQTPGSNNTLTRRDGLLVRSSDNALFVGTGRTTLANTVVSNLKQRFLSNVYNRISHEVRFTEPTVSWNPITANAIEPWGNRTGNINAGLVNRIEVINSIDLDITEVVFTAIAQASGAGASIVVGFTVDNLTSIVTPQGNTVSITAPHQVITASYRPLGVGYHFLQCYQYANTITSSFFGNNTAGVTGSHFC